MKFRQDYITNSSSASYIICFARIADEEKANKIIKKFNLNVYTADEVDEQTQWDCKCLGAEWAGAEIYGVDKILNEHPDSKYIIVEDYEDAYYDDEYDPIYSYDFDANESIEAITEANGFADIHCAEGEGRNG